ncbi:Brp/Blh family beta-carotene 15,15'-dioxygenase [uncultured Nonlabens sp.]|uniref:Brp/Blh family beta-carotene 15,15'-dioxygenase n=1 Tax=uncultured Nonlabens sp. TaxID=859306 RepID=UPI002628FD24|nr:Brp/Blh family beta-carotene 15,15'-dioxygenase [uncultured Nonlabens sp.]
MYNIILVLSFLALWIAIQIPENLEYYIGYFLVLTIGIGHGANDLRIYFNHRRMSIKKSIAFTALYAMAVLIGFGLFFLQPAAVLGLFLVVSGYHFGEEHFERFSWNSSMLKKLFETFYGLNIILCLLYLNATDSLPVIKDLTTLELSGISLEWSFYTVSLLTLLTGFFMFKNVKATLIFKELLYLIIIFIIFKTSSLIWGFTIYFILWHSIPSIHHQIIYLHDKVNRVSVLDYLKASIFYWIASLFMLGGLYYFLKEDLTLLLSIIVAFLGGITFPHVFVMNKLHN